MLKVAGAVLALAMFPVAGVAQDLGEPSDTVLLTISGEIGLTNSGETAAFDLAMLQALPVHEFSTTTIWTEGPQQFTGVELDVLLEHVAADGVRITASAINDYSVEIPLEEDAIDGALVAYLRNGEPMSVRDKGPLWIVFPFDAGDQYQTEVTFARSIWQLDRIEVVQ